jgi:RNA polymerase sigma-70 factor (ECF subfamily)
MRAEDALLEKLKTGSETGWDEGFQLLYPSVLAAARHPAAALTPAEAEDVAIEALTLLVPKVATIKSWEELRALAMTIAVRRAISEARKKSADKRGGNQTLSTEALDESSEGGFEPAALLESISSPELRELTALLQQAMSELDEITAKLIRHSIIEGVTQKELAQKYNLPIGTVGVHVYRGLKKVRQRIEKSPHLLKELNAYLRS